MYQPRHFQHNDTAALHALMQAQPLATLVTLAQGGALEANHIPLHLSAEEGELGVLRGHIAKANPLWREHPEGAQALVIFQGPQAYVSPAWYATKAETGKVVPTWNYLAVHAWGALRVVRDAHWLMQQVQALTQQQEAAFAQPWSVGDAPADYIDAMLRAVVGIEIRITRLQGKCKASQNQPEANRQGVIAGLRASGAATDQAMAHEMAQLMERERSAPHAP